MPTYAIGDIQGCCDEFEALLERIAFDPKHDRLWLVGDLVNRGPRSLDVLRLVHRLGDSVTTVLGNHDLHLLAVASTPGLHPKRGDTIDEILAAPDRDELLDWLRHRPILHHDPALNYTMVHAGVAPQWDLATARRCAAELEDALRDERTAADLFAHMYGNQPDRWSEDLQGFDRLRFITNCFTRLRFVTEDGRLALKHKGTIAQAPAGLIPWFQAPGRRTRGERIVCGHWSALGFYEGDDVLSIDTGCVWGGSLCAVRLDERAEPVFVACSSSKLKPGDD
jgi:bis(5'-nucleosyl)-tetraphosphatase (symmetrical)